MSFAHFFLVLIVVLIWGCNFIFVKFSLETISPLWLCTIRFLLSALPAVFFIKPPNVPFKYVISYGLVMFAMQFTCVFMGMHAGMMPGMASLLIQVQIFFSLFFAAVFLGEKPSVWQISGALISFLGIALVANHLDGSITFLGFLFIMGAAISWGLGNLITKKSPKMNMMALVVWGSLVASVPLLLMSLIFEGVGSLIYSMHHTTTLSICSLLYIVYLSTWVGYGIWNGMIARYSIGLIAPFTLLVPIIGMLSSIVILHESFQTWKQVACLLVMSGLVVNLLGPRLFERKVLKADTV